MERHEGARQGKDRRRLDRRRVAGFAALMLLVLAVSVAVPATAAVACLGKPQRDEQRDEWIEASLASVRMSNPRLRQPDPAEWAVVARPEPSPLEGEGGETVRFWVEELVEGDDLAALVRKDQLLAAGATGFAACVEWLVTRQRGTAPEHGRRIRRPEPPHVSSQREGEALQRVLDTVHAFLRQASDEPGMLPSRERAELAAVLATLLEAEQESALPARPRRSAYEALALCYTAQEAPVLARGLAQPDPQTQVVVASALSEFREPLAEGAVEATRFDGLELDVRRPLRLEEGGTWLVLAGRFPVAERETLLAVSSAESWRHAVHTLERRWRAAVAAGGVLVELLGARSQATRSKAVECLRRLTGSFERYRAGAERLSRQGATLRWSQRVYVLERWLEERPAPAKEKDEGSPTQAANDPMQTD